LQIYSALQNNLHDQLAPDEDYINQCRILTFASKRIMDASDNLLADETDLSKIPESEVQANGLLSRNKKEAFIGKMRRTVSEKSLKQLKQLTPQLKYDDDLEKYFQDNYLYIDSCRAKVPIIPFYLSVKMMLNFLYQYNQLLILNIKQFLRENNEPRLVSAKTLCFRYAGEKLMRVSKKHFTEDEAGLAVSMVTMDETFFDIKNQPLDILILLCGTSHCQTPRQAKGNINELQKDFADREKSTEPKLLMNFKNEINQCSIKEYQEFRELGHQYELIRNETHSTPPVVRIEHVYLSTLEKSRQHKREYLEKMQNLKLFTPRKIADSCTAMKETDHVHTI